MELQGLYELHQRLEAAAAAGVNLIDGDFRLRKALDGIAPLAAASPAVKKLYQSASTVISPDCEDRAGALLDTLALSEAILCTQAGYGVEGEMTALKTAERTWGPCRPHSVVKPLLEAMRGSGGGRYAVVNTALMEDPDQFTDYRLQAALVTALGDRSVELCQLAENYLSGQDKGFLPLLKRGFWQTTDGSRIRRLRVIAAIAGGEENSFYIELLEKAKKELREEAIYALRFEQDNAALLLDLLKTEKGNCLRQVKYTLAYMKDISVEDYWVEQMRQNPWDCLAYLPYSVSDRISDQVALLANQFLDDYKSIGDEKSRKDKSRSLMSAMNGKVSPDMCQVYRKAALSAGKDDMCDQLARVLTDSIIFRPDSCLTALAGELSETYGGAWDAPALAADLLTKPARTVYERYQSRIPKNGIFKRGAKEQKRAVIMEVFGRINYSPETKMQLLSSCVWTEGSKQGYYSCSQPLFEPLDAGWLELFTDSRYTVKEVIDCVNGSGMSCQMNYDQLLTKLIKPEQRKQLGEYLYDRALTVADNRYLYPLLVSCGWEDYKGLVYHFVEKNTDSSVSPWSVERYLEQLPMTEGDRQQEMERIRDLVLTYPKDSRIRKLWGIN